MTTQSTTDGKSGFTLGLLKDSISAFSTKGLRSAVDLQNNLGFRESDYLFIAGYAHSDSRAFFLYGILDEVIKVSLLAEQWKGFSGDSEEELLAVPDDNLKNHIARVVDESMIDQQALWQRKLIEILCDLILFESTNTQEHFQLYLLCRQLDSYLGLQKDFKEFFDCKNENAQSHINYLTKKILQIGKSINLGEVWFLKEKFTHRNLQKAGQIFRSHRQRYMLVLCKVNADLKISLRISYEVAYSGPSRSIHVNVGGPSLNNNKKTVDTDIGGLMLLSFHIISRACDLAGINPKGDVKFVKDLIEHHEGSAPEKLDGIHKKDLGIGDLVSAYGPDLGLIVDQSESQYGYKSYKVRYLTRPPLEEIPEDWFPARYIHQIIPRKTLRENLMSIFQKNGADEALIQRIQSLTEEDLNDALMKLIQAMEKDGTLESFFAFNK